MSGNGPKCVDVVREKQREEQMEEGEMEETVEGQYEAVLEQSERVEMSYHDDRENAPTYGYDCSRSQVKTWLLGWGKEEKKETLLSSNERRSAGKGRTETTEVITRSVLQETRQQQAYVVGPS